jgi:trans-2,3-dihydro-3-hydroxyanthranilate isomerase
MNAPASRRLPYTLLDVFTDTRLAGNPLAVVQDADGVTDDTMLRFARETRLSETTFVQSATASGADYRNRIFTMVGEVPFAGHPSLGTAVAVAMARGEREATYVQQTGAGLQPVEARLEAGRAHASVLQERAVFGAELDPTAVVGVVGLDPTVADPRLPPQIVSTGLGALIAPVADRAAVARARPDFEAIEALLAPHRVSNLYLVHCELGTGRAQARMFTQPFQEDPATGSAAGALCAYLAERAGTTRVEVGQGVEIERPSRLIAELEGDRVRVGGDVVVVAEGQVTLP